MKTRLPLLVLCIALALSAGCATVPNLQKILDANLPPNFEGDFHFDHANAYVQIPALDFTGLKKVNGLWTWTGMKYHGHSAFTATNVVLSSSK